MKCSFPVRVSNAEHNALTLREGRINYDDTDIRYGETLSVTVSDLVPNDLTAFALRLDPIFAGGNTDCTGHAATGPHDIPLSGTTTLVKGCDSGRGYIKLVSGMRVVSTGRFIRVDSSPRDLSATVNGTTVSLSWTRSPDPDFSAQHVERMQNGGARQFRVSSTASSYRDENVPYGTHTYKILVLDSAGRAETSNLVQVTLSPPVPTPTNTSIPATATKTPRPTATQPPLTVEPTVTKTPTPRPVSTQPPLTVEPTVTKTPTPRPTATQPPLTVEPTPYQTPVRPDPTATPVQSGKLRASRTSIYLGQSVRVTAYDIQPSGLDVDMELTGIGLWHYSHCSRSTEYNPNDAERSSYARTFFLWLLRRERHRAAEVRAECSGQDHHSGLGPRLRPDSDPQTDGDAQTDSDP